MTRVAANNFGSAKELSCVCELFQSRKTAKEEANAALEFWSTRSFRIAPGGGVADEGELLGLRPILSNLNIVRIGGCRRYLSLFAGASALGGLSFCLVPYPVWVAHTRIFWGGAEISLDGARVFVWGTFVPLRG
ncbi:hypothetical protein K438DRAFT_2022956 [Mycena galopus ATCC 62051]|nr:hypothetical protein K438DRAFT_2022956 [Mycena galopus ATCC 62051]